MVTNKKLQNAVNEIFEITGKNVALYSTKGKLIWTSSSSLEGKEAAISEFAEAEEENKSVDNTMFFKVFVEEETEYILVMELEDESMCMMGLMATCQIKNLLIGYAEHYDRNSFIQNVLMGNLLPVELISRAKKLHIDAKPRVAFVVDTGDKINDMALELVKNLSNMKSGDFVTNVDTHSVVLVKDVSHISENDLEEELKAMASSLVDNLHMEAMIKVRVGYGNVVTQVNDITDSFQQAKLALEVGRVFYAEKDTISYDKLGIGRLIYQLPMSLCDMFIKEVFGDTVPEILDDEEAMSTINKFFENNLNISETARQLYVHRNTLVYRLERIEKAIGLDIRTFDDAMTFRIAVMVLAHMKDHGEQR